MSRKLFLFLFALLAAILLPVGSHVLAQSGAPDALAVDPEDPNYPDIEPNNTPAQAVPVDMGVALHGSVSLSDPIDYYRFTVEAGDAVAFERTNWACSEPESDQPTLLDPHLNPVTLALQYPVVDGCVYWAQLLESGTYYVGLTLDTLLAQPRPYSFWSYELVDVEPNNIPVQASSVAIGDAIDGALWWEDTVDYYTFSGVAGDAIALVEPERGNWNVFVTMLDASLNTIPLQPGSNWVILPMNGTYYFKVFSQDYQEYRPNVYSYDFLRLTGDEPNDTFATAIPVEALATIQGSFDYTCDVDMYRFEGRAGDVFPIPYPDGNNSWDRLYDLYDENGTALDRVLVLPADGTYYLKVLGWWWTDDDWGCYYAGDEYTVTIGYPMWVSSARDAMGGSANRAADILMRGSGAGKWRPVFDGSDVGIVKNVDAFERMDDGSILMSLSAAQNVAGLGKVMPQDIIRFVATSLGSNTAGSFEWYLDGSDVGLTTASENIDAIYLKAFDDSPYALMISVSGSGSAPRQSGGTLNFRDEDLINFVGTAYGQVSAGKWRLNLDGSTISGMAAEDINAATIIDVYPDRNARLLLAFNSAFKVTGITGSPRDVVEIDPPRPDLNDSIVIRNLTTKPIDGLGVGVNVP